MTSPAIGLDLVRSLQERTARALPAEHLTRLGGWWLRHSPGCAWWVGTVLPHGLPRGAARPDALERRVVAVEEFYAARGAAVRFQISPGACPDGLDAVLAERGYRRHCAMSLRVAAAARVGQRAAAGPARVRLDDRPTGAWLEVCRSGHAVRGIDGTHRDTAGSRSERDLLARVERPSIYATALVAGEAVAVGRAVADTGWAGVFGMATRPQARGQGAAGRVLAALAGWATNHADRMYLQVDVDNIPALRLYTSAGFEELCGYHYRSRGEPPGRACAGPRRPPNGDAIT